MGAFDKSGSSFALDITRFVEKTMTKADEVMRALALELLAGVITKSPVDTGFFRANWRVGINKVDLSTGQPVVESAEKPKIGSSSKLYRNKAEREAAARGEEVKPPPAKLRHEKRLAKLATSAAATEAAGAAKAVQAKYGDTIHVTNNTEYGEALENGHSGQAPQGVMKVTFEEVKNHLETLVRQAG